MDVSNRFLAFLLVIAILVTVIGTWYSLNKIGQLAGITGFQTTGYVNVTIEGKTQINVTQPYCGFGSGYVTPGYAFAVLHPGNGTVGSGCHGSDDTKGNWTNTSKYGPECMEVRNDGNGPVWVNVSSGMTAAQFIGGTESNYTAWSENKETAGGGACAPGGIVNLVPFPGIEMNTSNRTMCSCLWHNESIDEMYVGCYLKIPSDAPIGAKADTWTFTAFPSTSVPDCGSL